MSSTERFALTLTITFVLGMVGVQLKWGGVRSQASQLQVPNETSRLATVSDQKPQLSPTASPSTGHAAEELQENAGIEPIEPPPEDLALMEAHAEKLLAQRDFAGAKELQVKILELRRRTQGEEDPDTLTSMTKLASIFRSQGNPSDAKKLQVKVLEIRRRTLGDEDPETLLSMEDLAETFLAQRDFAGAKELQVEVMQVRRRMLGEEHLDTLTSKNNLASTLRSQGNLAGALELEGTPRNYDTTGPMDSPLIADSSSPSSTSVGSTEKRYSMAGDSITVRYGKNIDSVTISGVQHGGRGGGKSCSFTVPANGIEEVVIYMNGGQSTVRGIEFYGKGRVLLGSALGTAVSRRDTRETSIGGAGRVVTQLYFTAASRINSVSGSTAVRKKEKQSEIR